MELNDYEKQAFREMIAWQEDMRSIPSLAGKATKAIQSKINEIIPDKVHKVVTGAIKQMVKGVITGADITTTWPKALRKKKSFDNLEELEVEVKKRIHFYKNAATAEGAATGFGGILLGLADFPLWLSIKMKMLIEMANLYGLDVRSYKERIYLLHIFEISFSSQQHRNKVFQTLLNWDQNLDELPTNYEDFDWRTFQLEYRDHIDLAKLMQLIPGVGAAVGGIVNHQYTKRLGRFGTNAFRMRYFDANDPKISQLLS